MSPRPDLGVWPLLGYAGSRIDRAAERRTDDDALAAMEQAAGTRAYAIGSDMVVLRKNGEGFDPVFSVADVRAFGTTAETAFLGLCDGEARFALALAPETIEALKTQDALFLTDLRSIAVRGLVEPDHLPPLAEGKSLLGWHATPSLLLELRRADPLGRGRLAARLPHLQDAAFPAHRSGRDHAGGRPAIAACSAAPDGSRRIPGRALPASSSRAKPSRTRCGARSWRSRPSSAAW